MAKPLIQVGRLQMDTISCKLCNKIYENPQILNCLHSFCATCLQQQISQGNYTENELLCPLCKECTYLKDGVENLPQNTMLARFILQAHHEELLLVCDRVISEDIRDLEKERSQSEDGVEDSRCHEIKHQSGNDSDQTKWAENKSEKESSQSDQGVEDSYKLEIKQQSGNDLDQSKCAENKSEKESSQSDQGVEGSYKLEIKQQSGNDLDQSKCAENKSEKESSQSDQGVEGSYKLEIKHQSGNELDQSKCSENRSEKESSQSEQSVEGSHSLETKHQSGNDLDKLKWAENQSGDNLDQSKSVENQSGVTSNSNSCLDGDFHSNSLLSDSSENYVSEERSNTRSVFTCNEFSLVSLVENTEEDVLRNQERKKALEAMKLRENVKSLVTNLQENALGVVYALESINLSYREWLDNRENVKKAIKERSMHLQKMIKCQERKLLSTVEDNTIENNMKQEMTNSKDQLQGVLRGTLNATEFLKLLIEFGNVTDFLTLQDIIKARASHLSNPNIQLRRQKFTFKPPLKESDNFIDEAFGQLKEESSVQNIELNTKQTTNCEDTTISDSAAADYNDKHFPIPLSNELQAQYSDESYGYSHYGLQYITVDKGSNSVSEDDHSTKSYSDKSSDVISEHISKTTTPRCRRRMSFNDISSRVQNIASKKLQTRRISVPANNSGITSNISQRRLCALSLLMRSKSQEEGTPSELETSANIAQLEWIRENIRKKTLSRQSSQPES